MQSKTAVTLEHYSITWPYQQGDLKKPNEIQVMNYSALNKRLSQKTLVKEKCLQLNWKDQC